MIRSIVLFITTASLLAGADQPTERVENLKLTLTSVAMQDLLKLGRNANYATAAPEAGAVAYRLRTKGGDVVLIDGNDDGVFDEQHDWMTLDDEKMLVPYSPAVFFPQGLLRLGALDKASKVLTCEFVVHQGLNANVYAAMTFLNRVRVRNGSAMMTLDLAMCRACDQHADYVATNHNTGMGLHAEQSGNPRYSPEGAAAAAGSSIYPMKPDLRAAMDGWIRTSWHAWPLIDPSTRSCGVTNKTGLSMFYRSGSHVFRMKDSSFTFPGADATGVPLSFNSGEIPAPVPGKDTGSLGMPIMWRSADPRQRDCTVSLSMLVKGSPVAVAGYASSPARPANPAWPHNSGLHLFVPAGPLKPATGYVVTIKMGDAVISESRFTTGSTPDFLGSPGSRR